MLANLHLTSGCVFTEQERQLQSYSKSVADLQAIKDQLEKKLLESTQQLQEETSGREHQMNELIKSHQVLLYIQMRCRFSLPSFLPLSVCLSPPPFIPLFHVLQ